MHRLFTLACFLLLSISSSDVFSANQISLANQKNTETQIGTKQSKPETGDVLYFVEIAKHENAPIKTESGWVSDLTPELAKTFDQLSVKVFRKAFADAKLPELSRTYFLSAADGNIAEVLKQRHAEPFPLIEQVPYGYPLYIPNDYYSPLLPARQAYWHLDAVNAPAAWDITQGREDIIIGVLEYQGRYPIAHEDLEGEFYAVNNVGNVEHALAVAHTASGKTDNNKGIASIGFRTKIYGASWWSRWSMDQDLANVKRDFLRVGVRVINMSFYYGDRYGNPIYSLSLDRWTQEMYNAGIVLVAGAGNQGTRLHYPASSDNVLSVTSVAEDLSHINNRNYPTLPQHTHTHNHKVDLTAPGYRIPGPYRGGYVEWLTGTSFASPMVAGTAALMLPVSRSTITQTAGLTASIKR